MTRLKFQQMGHDARGRQCGLVIPEATDYHPAQNVYMRLILLRQGFASANVFIVHRERGFIDRNLFQL
jgi:hypothetical protein